MADKNLVLGVDVGGSHITCAQIDLAAQSIVEQTKISKFVNSGYSAAEILNVWTETIKESFDFNKKPSAIGVAMPGPFDYENGISKIKGVGKFDSLFDINIKEKFSDALKIAPEDVKFMNDASCFALGEYYAGAGRGFKKLVAITLGTGFGSTFIDAGEIITSGKGIPEGGMFWNSKYKSSIADDYFSTRWFLNSYFKLTGLKAPGVLEIAEKYVSDSNAKKVFNHFSKNIAEFLIPQLKIFEPDVLVIGGGIAKSHAYFFPFLQKEFLQNELKTVIRISELWEDAAIIGCGNLFK